jgi:hypothetical protein
MGNWPHRIAGLLLLGLLGAGTSFAEEPKTTELQSIQESLGVGLNVARVTDASMPIPGASSFVVPEFILIQDVHQHPQVQSQIASLILHGYSSWGVKKVFLEGAFTSLDLSIFHRVPNRTRSPLMERLVNEGDLSGPEMAAVLIMEREWRDPPVSPFQLLGMEDPKLYWENVQAYQRVLAGRDRALEELVSIRRLQNSLHLQEPNPLEEQLGRVEALLRLKLTSAEYADYLSSKEAMPSTPALDPAVRAAEEFYRVAQLRSEAFLREAVKKVPASTAPRIFVVGGFHTAAMAALLRQEGHSFVIFSPSVSDSEAAPLYEKHMKETADVLAEALIPVPH